MARQAPYPWDSPGRNTGAGCHALFYLNQHTGLLGKGLCLLAVFSPALFSCFWSSKIRGDLVGVIFFVISQCLSASHVHVNHLGILLKHSFCFNRSEWSPEFLTNSKVMGTLLVQRSHFKEQEFRKLSVISITSGWAGEKPQADVSGPGQIKAVGLDFGPSGQRPEVLSDVCTVVPGTGRQELHSKWQARGTHPHWLFTLSLLPTSCATWSKSLSLLVPQSPHQLDGDGTSHMLIF